MREVGQLPFYPFSDFNEVIEYSHIIPVFQIKFEYAQMCCCMHRYAPVQVDMNVAVGVARRFIGFLSACPLCTVKPVLA